MPKYIFVTGGVVSSVGKGITVASIGTILKSRQITVSVQKLDPYLNVDPGTMSPYQHGEVFVTRDGAETDLDLGNYERFLDIELTREHNITTGKVYQTVIEKERRGDYLGKTVQIIPHVTNEIKERIRKVAKNTGAEICIIEIGGTVGDIESMPFLESVRQMHSEEREEDFAFVHVTLVPLDTQGEQKTKPTQHSVKELRSLGLQPDAIVARCKEPVLDDTKSKIALFCDVPARAVVSAHDARDIYYVPSLMEKEGLSDYLMGKLKLTPREGSHEWEDLMKKMAAIDKEIRIGVVGKYAHLGDSYISINEALKHAGIECRCRIKIDWIDAEEFERKPDTIDTLQKYNGILVPGGFGVRGTEGKILAIKYAREHNVPYLGLCLGMQLAVIEFARNVVGIKDANSSELTKSENPVIDLLPEQENVKDMGGTMRLGNFDAVLTEGSKASQIYGSCNLVERHRHRYEVNPKYISQIEAKGMKFTGRNDHRMEIAEIPGLKFFFSSQFHPEFRSRPGKPSPPFLAFVKAALG